MSKEPNVMVDQSDHPQNDLSAANSTNPRKTYEKPAISYHAPLEAMAGVCSPGKGSTFTCNIIQS
jgi:hypothetical protein